MGMPHDVYSMPTMTVFKGDTIVIHFLNTEEARGDHHSFTIKDKPYNLNVELSPSQNKTITFDANTTGIFSYYCTFHQPTMTGQLIVKPPPYLYNFLFIDNVGLKKMLLGSVASGVSQHSVSCFDYKINIIDFNSKSKKRKIKNAS